MTNEDEQNVGLDLIVPEGQTVTLNGVEVEAKPVNNDVQLRAAMEAEKRGQDNVDFFLELVAETLNQDQNEEFENVTAEGLKQSEGNILPLVMAVQEANGLGDFLDEEDLEEVQ